MAKTRTIRPRVTIALPVYNGENYLRSALESAIGQTFEDYELIIVDNASSDSTPDICQEFMARDPRIQYVRNEKNIGVNPNFDRCVQLATGKYFGWLAHDDELTPEYLRRHVEVLDQRDDVVLVHSLVQIIDSEGDLVSVYDSELEGAESTLPHERFRALTHVRHACTAMFGLYRLDALKKTQILSGNHHTVDRAMLAELSLIGKLVQIDEPLFRNREHAERYVRRVRPSERVAFHQRDGKSRIEVSQLMLMRDYKQAVEKHVSDPEEKARCQRLLSFWWFKEWNLLRLGVEISAQRAPWLYDWAKWVSDRLVKPKYPTVVHEKRLR